MKSFFRKMKVLSLLLATGGCTVATLTGVKQGKAKTLDDFVYVSLGDSMTSGFGLPDYYVDDDSDAEVRGVDYSMENGHKNVRGFLVETEKSYPGLLKAYFADLYKDEKNVKWIPLAQNASRIDDIYYTLSGDTEFDEFYNYVFNADDVEGSWEEWNDIFGERARDKGFIPAEVTDNNEATHQIFEESITKADVVTLSAGYNNFGCFISGKIERFIEGFPISYHFGGFDRLQAFFDRNEIDINIAEIYAQVKSIIQEAANFDLTTVETFDLAGMKIHVKDLLETLVLSFVSFCYYMNETTKLICELNPDVELIVLGLYNELAGLKGKFGTFELDISMIVEKVFQLADLYTMLGTEKADSYKFVDLEDDVVELHLTDLANGTLDETQKGHIYNAVYDLKDEFGLDIPTFADVKAGINENINTMPNSPGGFNLDNYLEGLTDAEAYAQKWTISANQLGAFTPYESSVADAVNSALKSYGQAIDGVVLMLKNIAGESEVNFTSLLAMGSITPEAIKSGAFDGLINIYLRILLSNGMWSHPNEEGHETIFEEIKNAIDNPISAREYGLVKLQGYLEEISNFLEPYIDAFIAEYGPAIEDAISSGIASIKSAIESVLGEITTKVEEVALKALKELIRIGEYVESIVKAVAERVTEIVVEVVARVQAVISKVIEGVKVLVETITEIAQWIYTNIRNTIVNLYDFIGNAIESIQDVIDYTRSELSAFIEQFWVKE